MKHEIKSNKSITECHVFSPETPGNYPSIVWLHGLNGNWSADSGGVGQQLKNGLEVPYVVYCANNPNQADWSKYDLTDLKELVVQGNHINNNVCGHSQGGMGTISAINLFPTFWKTAGICAGKTGCTTYSKFLPIHIKAWHGTLDKIMGTSVYKFINGIALIGGDATLLKYEGYGHGICSKAFNVKDPESYWKWLESKQ